MRAAPDRSGADLSHWANDYFGRCACSIVAFEGRARSPLDALFGGTGALVDTGSRLILLTAGHVMEEMDAICAVKPTATIWALGAGPSAEITRWTRDRTAADQEVAAYVPPEGFLPSDVGLHPWHQWPWARPRPVPGEYVFLVGFPGCARVASASSMFSGRAGVLESVVSVGERHFVLAAADAPRVEVRQNGVPPISDVGGMSGAPAFVLRDGNAELVGVVYEGGPDLGGTFFVAHTDHLSA